MKRSQFGLPYRSARWGVHRSIHALERRRQLAAWSRE